MASSTTLVVGSLKTTDNVPYRIQGMTVYYTTRQDVAADNKFVIVGEDGKAIKNDDDMDARFGFDVYGSMRDLIDFNEDARFVVERDYHDWLRAQDPNKPIEPYTAGKQPGPDGPDNPNNPDGPDIPGASPDSWNPITKDPSAHLLGFFITCLIVTIVVCLARLYAKDLIEGIGRLLG